MKRTTSQTTCENKGHFWQSTASPSIMRCGRTGCKATQIYLNGAWIETPTSTPKPATVKAEQLGMWA